MDWKLPQGWVLDGNGLKQNSMVSFYAKGNRLLSSILAKVWEHILRGGKWSIGTENLSWYYYVHHKLHMYRHGIEPGSRSWQTWDTAWVHSKHDTLYRIRDLQFATCTHVACTVQQFYPKMFKLQTHVPEMEQWWPHEIMQSGFHCSSYLDITNSSRQSCSCPRVNHESMISK